MAWTQADLDALKGAMKSGVKTVTFSDGRSVSYRSIKEMERVYRKIADEAVGRAPSVLVAKHVRR